MNEQRSRACTYVAALRDEAELQEGRQRLQIATEFKARKTAQGEEAARLSLLLTDHAQQENHGMVDFRTNLADLARIHLYGLSDARRWTAMTPPARYECESQAR